jgi:CheY-like chemotaxis protein
VELSTSAITVSDWLDKPIDQARLSAAVQRAALAGESGRPRILHVEDDPDVRQVISVLLYDMADLVAAPDLRTARRLLAQDHFDLILLDVGLPDGSGLDLLPQAGGLITPYTPVVLFSAQEIGLQTAQSVAAVLLKSRTSNDQFLTTVKSLIRKPSAPILELSTV